MYICFCLFYVFIISSPVYVFFPSFHTGNAMIDLYALGMDVTYIRSITGVTYIKTAIIQLHKLCISHSFNSISINSKNVTFIINTI